MNKQISRNDTLTLSKLADATRKEALNMPDTDGKKLKTSRQKKHELLLTFMANAKHEKKKPAPAKPRLLTTLLSFFL